MVSPRNRGTTRRKGATRLHTWGLTLCQAPYPTSSSAQALSAPPASTLHTLVTAEDRRCGADLGDAGQPWPCHVLSTRVLGRRREGPKSELCTGPELRARRGALPALEVRAQGFTQRGAVLPCSEERCGAGWRDPPAPAPAASLPCCSACLCWPRSSTAQRLPPRYSPRRPSAGQTCLHGEAEARLGQPWRRCPPAPPWAVLQPALPKSSTALTSACALIRSSSMPSTASRAARISGVVPSCMRASRSVARFRMRI